MPPAVPLEIAEYFTGVNRREDQQSIARQQLWTAQNFYPYRRRTVETRLGATRFNASAWTNATRGRNLIRYYPVGGTKRKIIALNLAGGDILAYADDTAKTLAEITGATSLSANKAWHFSIYQGALYAGNATESLQKITNGTTRADIGGTPGGYVNFPGPVYRNRLTLWGNPTYPKRVSYTNTFSEDVGGTGYITIEHPEDVSGAAVYGRDENRGVFGDLAIFTPTSTWIQRGDFGDLANGASLDRATDRLGTLSPLTLQDTPYGLMGLGYDGTDELVAFIVPVGGGRPIVVSEPIRTAESLPVGYRYLACAGYYKGFYRLSFVPNGGTKPTRQWWADLRYFSTSLPNLGIGWYGPMEGQTIGAFATEDESTDSNQLIAADGAAGYIDLLDVANTYTDFGTKYTAIFETKHMDGGDPLHYKTFQGFIVGAKATGDENVSVSLDVDEASATATETVPMTASYLTVGDATVVDESTIITGARYKEYVQYLRNPLWGQRASLKITYKGGRQFSIKRAAPLAEKSRRIMP